MSEKKPQLSSSALLRNTQVLGAARDCHVGRCPSACINDGTRPKRSNMLKSISLDQSSRSVRRRVEAKFPDEAEQLLKHRVRVIKSVLPFYS